MIFDISELIELQKKLDEIVLINHQIDNPMAVFIERKLALAVEVGELANEVKCFKYWSLKRNDNKDKIADEYADVLHFILSHSIYLKSAKRKYEVEIKKYNNQELSQKFLKLLELSAILKTDADCELFLQIFFEIAFTIDLNFSEISYFYKRKNSVNLQRQKDKY